MIKKIVFWGMVVAAFATAPAVAATYDYVYQDNITQFPFVTKDLDGIESQPIGSPYARLSVVDVQGGVDIKISFDRSFGTVGSLHFDYFPALSAVTKLITHYGPYPADPLPADQAYFYADDEDHISSYGFAYSFPDWKVVSYIVGLNAQYAFNDEVFLHYRNLAAGTSAADFVPQYLRVHTSADWVKDGDGYAYLLASAVPESGTASLFLAGLGVLTVVSARTRHSKPKV
jgi:hypothetical protein